MADSSLVPVALQQIAEALDVSLSSIDLQKGLLDNGATSISLVRLHHALRAVGIHLTLDYMVSANNIARLLDHIPQGRATFRDPVRNIKRGTALGSEPTRKRICLSRIDTAPNITRTSGARYPMTEIQLALLQAGLKEPGTNMICYHETHQTKDLPSLRTAWEIVIRSVPILNSEYELLDSEAYIVERQERGLDWTEVTVTNLESYLNQISHNSLEGAHFSSSFRIITLKPNNVSPGKSRVMWRIHHALIDGYSHGLVLAQLQKALEGQARPTVPFVRFVAGLHAIQRSSGATGKAYWEWQRAEHISATPHLLLPSAPKPDGKLSLRSETFEIHVDSSYLATISQGLGVTTPTLYYVAWALTMAKYADSDEICFGTVLSGRALPIPDCASIIGPAINTLPVYIKLDRCSTLASLIWEVFKQILELNSVQWTSPAHGYNRDFQTALNIHAGPHFLRQQLIPIERPYSIMRTNVPLQVEVADDGSHLISFHYHSDRYTLLQVKKLAATFKLCFLTMQNTALSVASCLATLMSEPEREVLCEMGNSTSSLSTIQSVKEDLVSLFIKATVENPSITALRRGSASLTYKQLYLQSWGVARRLEHFAQPGDVICVHADRSFEWIISIFSVLMAGAVYCPLAEDSPAAVRDSNFLTSGAEIFIVGATVDKIKRPRFCKNCVSIEELLQGSQPEDRGSVEPSWKARPESAAYLCFTSGSTGKPKGVLCQHRGLVAFQRDHNVRLRSRPGWKIAQFMSPAFDGSIHEIFSTLCYGGTLLLREDTGERQLNHLALADSAILTPSVARALDVHSFPNLRVVYFVGEAVTHDLSDTWATHKVVYNMYGPTEATCGATIKRLRAFQPVTLGSPVPSSRIYILDRHKQLAPRGTIGEIFLAGVQIGQGYIGRPEETASRFFPDTITRIPGEFMYKTGDKAYWDEARELILVGRSDRQIKLRGFRVDLDELEAQMLCAAKDVQQVAVTVRNSDLIAHVQPKESSATQFREDIRSQIPQYALPRWVVTVDKFPMTPAGKRDYKKLAETTGFNQLETSLLASSALRLEKVVVAALRDSLSLSADLKIEPDCDFLDLGASSVSLLFLSHRLSTLLQVKVPLSLIMASQNPRDLAIRLTTLSHTRGEQEGSILGETAISSIEKYWWYKYQLCPDTSPFNVTFACTLGSKVDTSNLARAWDDVLARHRVLRCKYQSQKGSSVSRGYHAEPPKSRLADSFDLDAESHRPFNLGRDCLIRVTISPAQMLVVASHIICDLVALDIILKEVSAIYLGEELENVRNDYMQTPQNRPVSDELRAFWRKYLQNVRIPRALTGKIQGRATWSGNSLVIPIAQPIHQLVKAYALRYKVTMHQMALAAVALFFQVDEEQCDITIGAPYMNRNSQRELETVGLFLQPLPVRITYTSTIDGTLSNKDQKQHGLDAKDTESYIRAVQVSSKAALAHALPFDQLLLLLDMHPTYPNHPVFDIMVTFHEAEQAPRLRIPDVKPMYTWTRGAKFKLMAEFTVVNGNDLVLRVEYSTECFEESQAKHIGDGIVDALQGLAEGKTFGEIRERNRAVW